MSPPPRGPRRILQWASKFTTRLLEICPCGEVFASSVMIGRMSLLREFREPFEDLSPRMIGFEGCEILFTHMKDTKAVVEMYLIRHFSRIEQSLGTSKSDNASWLQGLETPADGLTNVESGVGPIGRFLEPGTLSPGIIWPLRGISLEEGGG